MSNNRTDLLATMAATIAAGLYARPNWPYDDKQRISEDCIDQARSILSNLELIADDCAPDRQKWLVINFNDGHELNSKPSVIKAEDYEANRDRAIQATGGDWNIAVLAEFDTPREVC